jgi:predicted GIY-YIG superfamily endonuclease
MRGCIKGRALKERNKNRFTTPCVLVQGASSTQFVYGYVIQMTNVSSTYYVGMTSKTPETRLSQHMSGSGNYFLHQGALRGYKITLLKRLQFVNAGYALAWESKAIDLYRKDLVNIKIESASKSANGVNYENAKLNYRRLELNTRILS